MLEGVLGPGGTASGAAIEGYELAGKTGTAREGRPARRLLRQTSTSRRSSASRPRDDPKLLVAVMVDEPQGDIYGGQVAAPAWQGDHELRAELPARSRRVRLGRVDTLRTDATHEVLNQAVPFEDVNLLRRPTSRCARRSSARAAGWARRPRARHRRRGRLGRGAGARPPRRAQRAAAAHARPLRPPRSTRSSSTRRWHWLLRGAVEREIHALPWRDPRPGAHVARAALELLWTQANAGVMCPVSMTYSAVPALRERPRAGRRVGAAPDAARLRARRAVRAWR